jgi:hypothetical protein
MSRAPLLAIAVSVAALLAPSLSAGSGGSEQLPDPCRLLASGHPETALSSGTVLDASAGQLSRDYSGVSTVDCAETVGPYHVWLRVSRAARGVVPAGVVRLSKPVSGVGSGAMLERISFHGASSQWIFFHRGVPPSRFRATYAGVTVSPTHAPALESLARRLYLQL